MIINPDAPGGNTIFCDDIRHEITGKTTLVGTYNNVMIVSGDLPVTIPQICASITLRLQPPHEPIEPVFKIFRTDQVEPLFVLETKLEAVNTDEILQERPFMEPDAPRLMQLSVVAQLQGLVIFESCALKVRAYIGDDEVRLGALLIQTITQETAVEEINA